MKRIDLIVIGTLVVVFAGFMLFMQINKPVETDTFVIAHQGTLLMEVNAYDNKSYSFQGSQGTMIAEVEEGKIRLVHSECPEQICVHQHWISVDDNEPIICLPNEVIISSSTAIYN